MSRATLSEWLRAIERPTGPMPPELRHLCYVLGRFMNGDGADGCYPGTRTLAARIGVHRATVSRWLQKLVSTGWLDCEMRKRQFGRFGGHYFPAVPMAHLDAPIHDRNGAPRCAYSANGAEIGAPECANGGDGAMAHRNPELAHVSAELAHLDAPDSPTDSYRKERAASPSPADAVSAALPGEDMAAIRHLYLVVKFKPQEIWEKHLQRRGITLAQVLAVTNDLDQREHAK